MIYASYMRIKRTEQDRNFGAYRMYGTFAQIVETREVFRWDIEEGDGRVQFHLFVPALYGIRESLSGIEQRFGVIETTIIMALTEDEQDTRAVFMKLLNG